jgi:hypothetical protein
LYIVSRSPQCDAQRLASACGVNAKNIWWRDLNVRKSEHVNRDFVG